MEPLRATTSRLPKPITEQAAEQLEEDSRDQIRQTLYLPRGVHDQLREAAFSKRISMQEVVRQALNMWFSDNGLATWDEAKRGSK
jgi:hypothetical protein